MSMSNYDEILTAAMALEMDDRERLVRAVASSLDVHSGADDPSIALHPDWEAEIERRERVIAEGRVQLIDGEEAFRQVREMLAERKRLKT